VPDKDLTLPGKAQIERLSPASEHVLAIFDSEGWGAALLENGFDQRDLAQVVMDAMDPTQEIGNRLRGLQLFWKIHREIAELNGLIGIASVKSVEQMPDGAVVTKTAAVKRLLDRLNKEDPNDDQSAKRRAAYDRIDPDDPAGVLATRTETDHSGDREGVPPVDAL